MSPVPQQRDTHHLQGDQLSNQQSFGKFTGESMNDTNTRLRLYFEFPSSKLDARTIHNAVQRIDRVDPHTIQVTLKDDGSFNLEFSLMVYGMPKQRVKRLSSSARATAFIGLYRLSEQVDAIKAAQHDGNSAVILTQRGSGKPTDRRAAQRKPSFIRSRR